jgi:hypothetical protein
MSVGTIILAACATPCQRYRPGLSMLGMPGDPSEPHLLITDGLRGYYAALSHCWGGNIATCLKTNTLSIFQTSLPYAQLPQNFRDAISITRELGVRYLWIDSLCIVQDSMEDWTAESARMGQYIGMPQSPCPPWSQQTATPGF